MSDIRLLRAQANLLAVDVLLHRANRLLEAGHLHGAATLHETATRLRDEADALVQEISL